MTVKLFVLLRNKKLKNRLIDDCLLFHISCFSLLSRFPGKTKVLLFHVSRFTFHVSRFTFYVSRFMFHVLCFTFYVSRFMFHVLCFMFYAFPTIRTIFPSFFNSFSAIFAMLKKLIPAFRTEDEAFPDFNSARRTVKKFLSQS